MQLRARAMGVQRHLDRIAPLVCERWIAFFALLVLFMYVVVSRETHFVVCYALWIYLLNGFILFLSPFHDPDEDGDSSLPRAHDDEFRPFIRKLPEMAFWRGATTAALLSLFTLPLPFFDIPVFWPVLVVYFVLLTVLMLRKQIGHMLRHRYIPFTVGKTQYREGDIRL